MAAERTLTAEKEIMLNVIEMYREMPHLYNKNNENYLNKSKREESYRELLTIYRNVERDATIKSLKKKIDNLKTSYFREFKKVKASRLSGAGEYVPTLWYYDTFSFLGEPGRQPADIQEIEFEDDSESFERSALEAALTGEPRESASVAPKKRKHESSARYVPSFSKKKSSSNHNGHEHVPCASCAVSNYLQRRDEAEVVAKSWALDLQKMDKMQQIFAKKAINEILLEGQLGNLHHQFVRFEQQDAGGAAAWVTEEAEDHDIESDSDYVPEKKHNPFGEGSSSRH